MLGPEAVQAAAETAKQAGPSSATAIGVAILVIGQIGIWLDKAVAYAKARAERKRAEADVVEAKNIAHLTTKPPAPGNGSHADFIMPHALALERHEGEIKNLQGTFVKLDHDNREDHGKIFTKLDDLKDLLVEELGPGHGARS
jgi:hypothetical protein